MSPDQLAATAGIVLSLLLSYTPGLSTWFDNLKTTPKRLLVLGLTLAVAAGALVYQCQAVAVCLVAGWQGYLTAFISVAIASQAAYLLTPLSAERRAVRAAAAGGA